MDTELTVAELSALVSERLDKSGGYGVIWAQAAGVDGAWQAMRGGGVIGKAGTIPWHLPEELKWFRKITAGSTVIMGRRTWESLPASYRPLPGRTNIVVTSESNSEAFPGAVLCADLASALAYAAANSPAQRVWVIGGGQLYRAALASAAVAAITQIKLSVTDADTFAPELPENWQITAKSAVQKTSQAAIEHVFTLWQPGEPHSEC